MHKEVLAEYQLDAHVPGEEAVFKICGVVWSRRKQHDARRFTGAVRGHRCQGFAQPMRVVFDTSDAAIVEQFREHLLHHRSVFQYVTDTGRCAAVVLQHQELSPFVADQVGAANVNVLLAGGREADHFLAKALRPQDE